MPAKHSSKILLKSTSSATKKGGSFVSLIDKALSWGLGILCLLVSVSFYTGTYDTAFVKITLFQTGALILSALWLSLLSVEKRCPVTRQNLPWVLPFLLYFGWNFLGYLLSPYKLAGFDEFFRYILYFFLSFIVLDRFTQDSAKTLTKCIVLAAWISCLYGAVQILDRWFVGIDIMPWRGFFGTRIFSTHANPNFFADFIVFSSCIVIYHSQDFISNISNTKECHSHILWYYCTLSACKLQSIYMIIIKINLKALNLCQTAQIQMNLL